MSSSGDTVSPGSPAALSRRRRGELLQWHCPCTAAGEQVKVLVGWTGMVMSRRSVKLLSRRCVKVMVGVMRYEVNLLKVRWQGQGRTTLHHPTVDQVRWHWPGGVWYWGHPPSGVTSDPS